ncbi:S8 family serine peptidase, partial [Streptomyces sp. S3(2020)]|uniref:S8 family serine peptidase n=1 Tax=Streptomyces sp. S3(2020) TaxID=2732044 RepID=UPI001487779C
MKRTLVSLTLVTVCAACLGATASAAPLSADQVSLPVVPSALADGVACTKASTAVAKAVPWEQGALGLERTWAASAGRAGGSGVTVGVVDTGVAAGAPSLKGRVTAVGSAGADCVGHGTFVAGLIAATQETGVRFAGVADRARVLAVRGTDERGAASAGSVAAGIRSAAKAGAEVIVVSPALSTGSEGLTAAVAYATTKDALVIAAAAPDPVGSATDTDPSPQPRLYRFKFNGGTTDVVSAPTDEPAGNPSINYDG